MNYYCNIKDIYTKDINNYKYIIFNIINLIGCFITIYIANKTGTIIIPTIIVILTIISLIFDFVSYGDTYFYIVNFICLGTIILYLCYAFINRKKLQKAEWEYKTSIYNISNALENQNKPRRKSTQLLSDEFDTTPVSDDDDPYERVNNWFNNN